MNIVPYIRNSNMEDAKLVDAFAEMHAILVALEDIKQADKEDLLDVYEEKLVVLQNMSAVKEMTYKSVSVSEILRKELLVWLLNLDIYIDSLNSMVLIYVDPTEEEEKILQRNLEYLMCTGYYYIKKEFNIGTPYYQLKKGSEDFDIPDLFIDLANRIGIDVKDFIDEIGSKAEKYMKEIVALDVQPEIVDQFIEACDLYENVAINNLDCFTIEEVIRVALGHERIEDLLADKKIIGVE